MTAEEVGAGGAEPTEETSTASRIASAVLAVPGVNRLSGGTFGEIATVMPGGRITGVALSGDRGAVHVVLGPVADLRWVAERVRDTAEAVAGLPVDVTVDDIEFDSGPDASDSPESDAAGHSTTGEADHHA